MDSYPGKHSIVKIKYNKEEQAYLISLKQISDSVDIWFDFLNLVNSFKFVIL